MSRGLLGVSMNVVNSIWSMGTETYKMAKNEINDAIDNEAEIRTRKTLGNIADDSSEYKRIYAKERENVEKDAKDLAVKGGLLAVGIGLFF